MASETEPSCVCDPNFAVICSFLERFAKPCGITHPNTLELQEMLENSLEVPAPLVDLHVKLLRKAKKSVSTERWERALIKFCHTYSNQDGWEIERFGYKKARLAVKLRVLKMLLELQFDLNTKFKAEINRLSAEELRCRPLGRDKLGQTYWCQQDEDCNLRVYREDLDDETWEVVAKDRQSLVQLISQLSSNDPFRKPPEGVLNEDSNSLETEKPITDTGQVKENVDTADGSQTKVVDSDSNNEVSANKMQNSETQEPAVNVNSVSEAVQRTIAISNVRQPSIVLKRCADMSITLVSNGARNNSNKNDESSPTKDVSNNTASNSSDKEVSTADDNKTEMMVNSPVLSKTEEMDNTAIISKTEEKDNSTISSSSKLEDLNDRATCQSTIETGISKEHNSDFQEKLGTDESDSVVDKVGDPLQSVEGDGIQKKAVGKNDLSSNTGDVKEDTGESNKDDLKDVDKMNSSNVVDSGVSETNYHKISVDKALDSSDLVKDVQENVSLGKPRREPEALGMELSKPHDSVENRLESTDKTNDKTSVGIDLTRKPMIDLSVAAQNEKIDGASEKEVDDLNKKSVSKDLSVGKIKIVVPEEFRESRDQLRTDLFQNSAAGLSTEKLSVSFAPTPSVLNFDTFSSLKLQKERLMKKRFPGSVTPNEAKRLCLQGISFTPVNQKSPVNVTGEVSDDDDEEEEDLEDEDEEDELDDEFDESLDSEVGEAIEEPLMFVRGEGSGEDCDTGNPGKEDEESKKEEKPSAAKDTPDSSDNATSLGDKRDCSLIGTDKVPDKSCIDESSKDIFKCSESVKSSLQGSKILENGLETEVSLERICSDREEHKTFSEESQNFSNSKIGSVLSEGTGKISSNLSVPLFGSLASEIDKSRTVTKDVCSEVDVKDDTVAGVAPLPVTKRFLQSSANSSDKVPVEVSAIPSPVKTPPKLWSIEAICAPDDKPRETFKPMIDTNVMSELSTASLCSPGSKLEISSETRDKLSRVSLGVQLIQKSPPGFLKLSNHESRWDVGKPTVNLQNELKNCASVDDNTISNRPKRFFSSDLSSRVTSSVADSESCAKLDSDSSSGGSGQLSHILQPKESHTLENNTSVVNRSLHSSASTGLLVHSAENRNKEFSEEQRRIGIRSELGQGVSDEKQFSHHEKGEKQLAQGFFFGPGCLPFSMKSEIKLASVDEKCVEGTSELDSSAGTKKSELPVPSLDTDPNSSVLFSGSSGASGSDSCRELLDLTKTVSKNVEPPLHSNSMSRHLHQADEVKSTSQRSRKTEAANSATDLQSDAKCSEILDKFDTAEPANSTSRKDNISSSSISNSIEKIIGTTNSNASSSQSCTVKPFRDGVDSFKETSVQQAIIKPLSPPHLEKRAGNLSGKLSGAYKPPTSTSHPKSNRRKSLESISMGIMMGKLAAKSSLQESSLPQLKSLEEVMGASRSSLSDKSNSSVTTGSAFTKPSELPSTFISTRRLSVPSPLKPISEEPENLSKKNLAEVQNPCKTDEIDGFKRSHSESDDQPETSENVASLCSKSAIDLSMTSKSLVNEKKDTEPKISLPGLHENDDIKEKQLNVETVSGKEELPELESDADDKKRNDPISSQTDIDSLPSAEQPVKENSQKCDSESLVADSTQENKADETTKLLENGFKDEKEHTEGELKDSCDMESDRSENTNLSEELPTDVPSVLDHKLESKISVKESNERSETSMSATKSVGNKEIACTSAAIEGKVPGIISVVPFERLSAGKCLEKAEEKKEESLKVSDKSVPVTENQVVPSRGLKVVPFEKLSNKASVSAPLIQVVPFEKLSDKKPPPNFVKEPKPPVGIKVVPFEKLSEKKLLRGGNSQVLPSPIHEQVTNLKSPLTKMELAPSYLPVQKNSETVMIKRVQKQIAKKLQSPSSETPIIGTDVLQSESRNRKAKYKTQSPVKALDKRGKGAEDIIADKAVLESLKNKDVQILPVSQASTGNQRPTRGRLQVKSFAKEILSVEEKSKQKTEKNLDNFCSESSTKILGLKEVEILKSPALTLEPVKNKEKAKDGKKKVQPSVTFINLNKIKPSEQVVVKSETPANISPNKTRKNKKASPAIEKPKEPENLLLKIGTNIDNSNKKGKKGAFVNESQPVRTTRSTRSRSGPLFQDSLPPSRIRKGKSPTVPKLEPEVNLDVKPPVVVSPAESSNITIEEQTPDAAIKESSADVPVKEQNGSVLVKEEPGVDFQPKDTIVGLAAKGRGNKRKSGQSNMPVVENVEESRRKRNRTQTESEIGSEDAGGKRRKVRGKRVPNLQLRRSVEEQKQNEAGESSSDDDGKAARLGEGEVSTDDSHSRPLAERKSKGKSSAKGRARRHSSEAPVGTATSDDMTPQKPKGKQSRRASKLLGLDVGVDIFLDDSKSDAGDSGGPAVRQSRRIAQIKIKEQAERRKIEEMTLFQLKEDQHRRKHSSKHKDSGSEKKKKRKKMAESDDDYTAEEKEEEKKSDKKKKRKKKKKALYFNENNPWQSSSGSSSSQEEEEDLDHTDFEEEEEEEVVLDLKSDHEFSPESDLEEDSGEALPTRRARTAQKDEASEEPVDEYACQKCGKSDHPEWILLCDKCDSGWHGSCLRPALLVIPEGDWFCPPCEHTTLLDNLEENLRTFDKNSKRRENEELRKKRLAYVGISLDNVLPNREKDDDPGRDRKAGRSSSSSSSSTSSSSSSSSDSSGDESEPVYQLRQRRQALFSYRFNEYDDLINSAIQDEMEAVKGAGNLGRGKDISTIVNAEKEEEEDFKGFEKNEIASDEAVEDKRSVEKDEGAEKEKIENGEEKDKKMEEAKEKDTTLAEAKEEEEEEDEEEEEEEEEEEKRPYIPPVRRFPVKKKHRRLNSLDINSEDDADSDEDFKGSSSDEDEDEDYDDGDGDDSDDSDLIGRRRRGGSRRHKSSGPVRRSGRARRTRFDKEFINDDSEDSEPRKKSRRLWQESDSEESDTTWGARKKRKQTVSFKPKSKKKKKKERYGEEPEFTKKKKPKIKYGGLDDEDDSPVRRTRGRKINYQEMAGSETEEEVINNSRRKIESEDEYVAAEEEDEEEGEDGKATGSDSDGDVPDSKKGTKEDPNSEDETVQAKKSANPESKTKNLVNFRLKKNVIRDDSESEDEMKQIEDEMKAYAEEDELAAKSKQGEEEKIGDPKVEEISSKGNEEKPATTHPEEKNAIPPVAQPSPKPVVVEKRRIKQTARRTDLAVKRGKRDAYMINREERQIERKDGLENKEMKKKEDNANDAKNVECAPPLKDLKADSDAKLIEKEVKETPPVKPMKGRIEVVPMEVLCGKPVQKDMHAVQLLKNISPLQQKDNIPQALKDFVVSQALKGTLDDVGGSGISEPSLMQAMKHMSGMPMGPRTGMLDVQSSPPLSGTQALKNMMNMHALKGTIEPEMGKCLGAAPSQGDLGVGGMPGRPAQGLMMDNLSPTTPTKRRGRGRGRGASSAAASVPVGNNISSSAMDAGQVGVGSRYPPPQHFQPHSSASVISRMLQSQPVSSGPQSFTAAAAAMGHKYFGSSGSDQPPVGASPTGARGPPPGSPYSVPPKGRIPSPYRQTPPLTEPPTSSPGVGISGHYGNSSVPRGSPVRPPLGSLQQMSHRMRNPGPNNNQGIYHSTHHPLDPSPSGGGPIVISSSPGRTGEGNSPLHLPPTTSISPSASSPIANKTSTPASHNTPPPPPYSRPGPPLPMVPGQPPSNPSVIPFPVQSSDQSSPNIPPVRHPPPPFPSSTSISHLQQPSTPPPHQGRSPIPGNFSPYQPPPSSNYHYGTYPPSTSLTAADDALPSSAYQGSPYPDHYGSSDATGNAQTSDGSNSKSYDEGGGEFGGLVSYFSSQREDDLDT